MEAQAKQAQPTASQPGKSIQMGVLLFGVSAPHMALLSTKWKLDALNPATTASKQHEHQHKARRLRGGGAARVSPLPTRSPSLCSTAPLLGVNQSLSHAPLPSRMLTRLSPFRTTGLLHRHDRVLHLLRYVLTPSIPVKPSSLTGLRDLPFQRMLQGSSLSRLVCLPSSSWLLPHRFHFKKIPFFFLFFTFRLANRKTRDFSIQDCCECFADIVCKFPSPLPLLPRASRDLC